MPLCVFRVPIFPPSEGVQETAGNASPSEGGRGRWRTGNALQPFWSGSCIFPPSEGVQKMAENVSLSEGGRGTREHGICPTAVVERFPHFPTFGRCAENGRKRLTFGRWERALEDWKCPTAVVERFPHFPTFGRCAENGRKRLTFGRWAERDRKHPAFGRWTTCNDI